MKNRWKRRISEGDEHSRKRIDITLLTVSLLVIQEYFNFKNPPFLSILHLIKQEYYFGSPDIAPGNSSNLHKRLIMTNSDLKIQARVFQNFIIPRHCICISGIFISIGHSENKSITYLKTR